MNKKILNFISKTAVIIACLFTFTACPDHKADPDYVNVDKQQLQFGWKKGNQLMITIESNTKWTMDGPNNRIGWLMATSTSGGSGSTTVVISTTQDNLEETPRTETIIIIAGDDSKIITVTQLAQEIDYFLTAGLTALEFDKQEGSKKVYVSTNDEWTVTSSDASWCKAEKVNNNNVQVSVSANSLTENRSATITITGIKSKEKAEVKVTQHGDSDFDVTDYDPDTDIDNNVEITMNVTPTTLSTLEATALTQEFSITGNDNWTATVNADWCRWSTTGGTSKSISGEGEATLLLSVDANAGIDERKVNIAFKGEFSGKVFNVDVKQKGTVYTLTLDTSSHAFDAIGGSKTIVVTSNDSWTASSSASWCTVSPSSGKGNGSINVKIAENSTINERTATVTVKGTYAGSKTFVVTQKGTTGFDRDGFDSDKNID